MKRKKSDVLGRKQSFKSIYRLLVGWQCLFEGSRVLRDWEEVSEVGVAHDGPGRSITSVKLNSLKMANDDWKVLTVNSNVIM